MISLDDMHSENVFFSGFKPPNYRGKLRCHACEGRRRRRKVGKKQYSGRPETAKTNNRNIKKQITPSKYCVQKWWLKQWKPKHFKDVLNLSFRVVEVGSLSSKAKMAMKIFVKRVFTIFATNASFLCVILISRQNSVFFRVQTFRRRPYMGLLKSGQNETFGYDLKFF